MRSQEMLEAELRNLSPAARRVYEQLVQGTYAIDVDDLADTLLVYFEGGAVEDERTVSAREAAAQRSPSVPGSPCEHGHHRRR
ncbi:hypothetical protein [Haliangium ochraceum]|uniref:Uncharacterized protein n=1 Tax=Haliangium ochraceum (strain DSM 14365 / JCM 11303 / SMP-2) TaxID=502025 RepID=D0LJT0_HALO1|nr:hypothetical protein [Haliangium ochraceum]ACY18437.1 hypothetical protein Hoch_5962 [Haliangium ochraceum DSM 14365]